MTFLNMYFEKTTKYSKILEGVDVMLNYDLKDKSNQTVLGVMIRTKRSEIGYSLRDLAELTNISHTLISNIETGKQVASDATLSDIFRALDLKLFDDEKISVKFKKQYNLIFRALVEYEYDKAKKLVTEIEKDHDIYEHSYEVINYNVIRCFYYTLTNTPLAELSDIKNKYDLVVEFLNENQKQMFSFIKGLQYINMERYKDASNNFYEALKLGDKNVDVLIKEYNARALLRQYKFTDTMALSDEAIEEYEKRTDYIRAMRCRLTIVRIYLHIMQIDKVLELVNYVDRFASKMKIQSLVDQCNVIRATCSFSLKDYKNAESYLSLHQNQSTHWLILPWFRIYTMLRDGRVHDYYKNVVIKRQGEITRKKFLLIKVLYMWHFDEMRNDEEYESAIIELIKEGRECMDQEVITLAYNLHIIYYKEKRSYKKALEIVDEFLQLKKIYI